MISFFVAAATPLAVTGKSSWYETRNISGSKLLSVEGAGNLDSMSAFPCSVVLRKRITYWCGANCRAHLCSQAADKVGTPVLALV